MASITTGTGGRRLGVSHQAVAYMLRQAEREACLEGAWKRKRPAPGRGGRPFYLENDHNIYRTPEAPGCTLSHGGIKTWATAEAGHAGRA
jgi:hypothetical protein